MERKSEQGNTNIKRAGSKSDKGQHGETKSSSVSGSFEHGLRDLVFFPKVVVETFLQFELGQAQVAFEAERKVGMLLGEVVLGMSLLTKSFFAAKASDATIGLDRELGDSQRLRRRLLFLRLHFLPFLLRLLLLPHLLLDLLLGRFGGGRGLGLRLRLFLLSLGVFLILGELHFVQLESLVRGLDEVGDVVRSNVGRSGVDELDDLGDDVELQVLQSEDVGFRVLLEQLIEVGRSGGKDHLVSVDGLGVAAIDEDLDVGIGVVAEVVDEVEAGQTLERHRDQRQGFGQKQRLEIEDSVCGRENPTE